MAGKAHGRQGSWQARLTAGKLRAGVVFCLISKDSRIRGDKVSRKKRKNKPFQADF